MAGAHPTLSARGELAGSFRLQGLYGPLAAAVSLQLRGKRLLYNINPSGSQPKPLERGAIAAVGDADSVVTSAKFEKKKARSSGKYRAASNHTASDSPKAG